MTTELLIGKLDRLRHLIARDAIRPRRLLRRDRQHRRAERSRMNNSVKTRWESPLFHRPFPRSNSTWRRVPLKKSARGMNWSRPINSRFRPSCRTMPPAASIARPISINCWMDCGNPRRSMDAGRNQPRRSRGRSTRNQSRARMGRSKPAGRSLPLESPTCGPLPRALGLSNWDKPAAACLSSRIPRGIPDHGRKAPPRGTG